MYKTIKELGKNFFWIIDMYLSHFFLIYTYLEKLGLTENNFVHNFSFVNWGFYSVSCRSHMQK